MKVGKPMSKRVSVRLRHNIQKASASKQRKQRKDTKKNPQWRSRLKKDPGIPNLFPYKAKMLAEIEENKRRKEEEIQRRRDVAKAQRQGTAVVAIPQKAASEDAEDDDELLLDLDEDDVEDEDDVMDEQDGSNPMAALLASAKARAQAYASEDGSEDGDDEDEEGEWGGIPDSATKSTTREAKALPKQALADPIKAVSALLDRMQQTTDGIQRLIEHYQVPALMTASTGFTSSFLVEVARKRGRLNRGGVPNLHSAALTVLSDLNEGRLQLPSVVTAMESRTVSTKSKVEVEVVSKLAEPFRIEGLWGDGFQDDGATVG